MTIIGLQRRLVQVGRIRMGEQVEFTRGDGSKGRRAARLEQWRLTSRDRVRLQAAAQAFGGEVREWEARAGEFELYTETDSLPVLLIPGQAISQAFELWSGGGCKRRCDGEIEQLTDGPCVCDPDARECKPHTRLNVLLPDVAGIGCWRLDTQGYYAATELAGTVELLELAAAQGVLLPARLRIDQRSVLREGQTRRFPVPTLDIDVKPLEMHAIARGAAPGELAGLTPGESAAESEPRYKAIEPPSAPGGVSIAEGLAAADRQAAPATRTARSAAPFGADEDELDSGVPVPIGDGQDGEPEPEPNLSTRPAAEKAIMARARELEISDAERYEITASVCGAEIRSVRRVPREKVPALLEALELYAAKRATDVALETPIEQLKDELRACGDTLGNRVTVDQALALHGDDRAWITKQITRMRAAIDNAEQAS